MRMRENGMQTHWFGQFFCILIIVPWKFPMETVFYYYHQVYYQSFFCFCFCFGGGGGGVCSPYVLPSFTMSVGLQ